MIYYRIMDEIKYIGVFQRYVIAESIEAFRFAREVHSLPQVSRREIAAV